jgi:predicted HTH transcriptional regulator
MGDHSRFNDQVLRLVHAHGSITNRELRMLFGVSYDDATRILGGLVDSGKLSRVGISSATKYVIANYSTDNDGPIPIEKTNLSRRVSINQSRKKK